MEAPSQIGMSRSNIIADTADKTKISSNILMNKFINYPYHRTHDYHVEKLLNIVQEKQRAFV